MVWERERERGGRERERKREREGERERGGEREKERERERERERKKSYTLVIFFGCSAGLFYHGHHHSCRGFQHGIIWTANAREQSIIPCQRRNEPEHTSQNKTLPANHSIDFLIGMSWNLLYDSLSFCLPFLVLSCFCFSFSLSLSSFFFLNEKDFI